MGKRVANLSEENLGTAVRLAWAVNHRFWSNLGCSERSGGLIKKKRRHVHVKIVSFEG